MLDVATGRLVPTSTMTNQFNAYAVRNSILKEMGFASYGDYLESPLWRESRAKVLMRDGHKCRGCGRRANQVHHRQYSRSAMDGSDLSRLESICRKCHKSIEFKRNEKLPIHKANAKLTKKVGRAAKRKAWLSDPEYRRLVAEKKRLQSMNHRIVKEQIKEVSARIRRILKQARMPNG